MIKMRYLRSSWKDFVFSPLKNCLKLLCRFRLLLLCCFIIVCIAESPFPQFHKEQHLHREFQQFFFLFHSWLFDNIRDPTFLICWLISRIKNIVLKNIKFIPFFNLIYHNVIEPFLLICLDNSYYLDRFSKDLNHWCMNNNVKKRKSRCTRIN